MGLFKDVASVVSPIIGSAADLWGGMQSNKLAASNAQANRDFQYYMASNAHQLEVQDLKKAGLNPILSANAGATASGGANAAFINPAQGVSSGLNSAAQLLQQQNLVKAQTDQLRSLADKNASDASVAQSTLPLVAEQIRTQRTQQQANSAVAAYNTAQLGVLPAIIQREMATAAREMSQVGLNNSASMLNASNTRFRDLEYIGEKPYFLTRGGQLLNGRSLTYEDLTPGAINAWLESIKGLLSYSRGR